MGRVALRAAGPGRDRDRTCRGQLAERGDRARLRQRRRPVSGRAGLAGRDVLVVGAGSMSALAVAAASRDGAASIVVANRTRRRAERLAIQPGVAVTRVAGLAHLPAVMADADVVNPAARRGRACDHG